MLHFRISTIMGLILTCEPAPLCALIHRAPDCMAKRAAARALDRVFAEPDHCRRVAMTYALGRALRGGGVFDLRGTLCETIFQPV